MSSRAPLESSGFSKQDRGPSMELIVLSAVGTTTMLLSELCGLMREHRLNDDRRDDVRGHNARRQAEQRVQAHEQQQENRDEYTDQEQRERPEVRCDDQVLGKVSLLPGQERVKQQRNDRYQRKHQG